jgi:outer membrane lipoprotein-sorting protein
MKSYNELQINNYDESDAMFSPSVIFTMYNDNFIYRTKEEYKNAAGKSIKVIELTPVDKTKDFFKIDLTINQTDMLIEKSKIYEKSGIQYIYHIKKFTPNVTFESGFFTFKTENYKGVKVSDLR